MVTLDAAAVDAENARVHGDDNRELIAASLREYGGGRSLVLDGDNNVVAGNGTLEAAREGGQIRRLVIVDGDDETLVAVRRRDWDERQARGYAITDNRASDLSTFDDATLVEQLGQLEVSDDGLRRSLNALAVEHRQPPRDIPQRPETPARGKPRTKPGDVWKLGDHRVWCGDCTQTDEVLALCELRARLTFTSPPYGIDLEYEQGPEPRRVRRVDPRCDSDQLRDQPAQRAFATMNYADIWKDGEFHLMSGVYQEAFQALGWQLRGNRVWLKPTARISLGYARSTSANLRDWEYARTWVKGAASPRGRSQREAPTLDEWAHLSTWRIGREDLKPTALTLRGTWATSGSDSVLDDWRELDVTTDKGSHPAAFPLVLPVAGIRAYTTKGDLVFDPFLGSGSTLLAAEIEGRTCFGCELSPWYCDMIVDRWQEFTGNKAKR